MSEEKTLEEKQLEENKGKSEQEIEKAKELLKKEQQAKLQECIQKVSEILKEYDCKLATQIFIAPNKEIK